MPRISESGGPSNADLDREDQDVLVRQGVLPSVGISSSTSEKKPESSGSGLPEMDQSILSPVHAGSLSGQDLLRKPAQFSTAPSTDGSTQETGPDQQSPLDSSEVLAPAPPATTETTEERDKAHEMLREARLAFDSGDLDMADEFLDEADLTDPALKDEISAARAEIMKARSKKKK